MSDYIKNIAAQISSLYPQPSGFDFSLPCNTSRGIHYFEFKVQIEETNPQFTPRYKYLLKVLEGPAEVGILPPFGANSFEKLLMKLQVRLNRISDRSHLADSEVDYIMYNHTLSPKVRYQKIIEIYDKRIDEKI